MNRAPRYVTDTEYDVSHDGDIVRIAGRALRMEYMVLDAFWAHGCAIVLLDPAAYLDSVAFSRGRRKSRDPLYNLRAYAPGGELLWQAEPPEPEDHYYKVESRDPLRVLSFAGSRCDIDPDSGRVLNKQSLK